MNKQSANSQDFSSKDIARRAVTRGNGAIKICHPIKRAARTSDIFFGPEARGGAEPYFICAVPDESWLSSFHFFGTETTLRDRRRARRELEQK